MPSKMQHQSQHYPKQSQTQLAQAAATAAPQKTALGPQSSSTGKVQITLAHLISISYLLLIHFVRSHHAMHNVNEAFRARLCWALGELNLTCGPYVRLAKWISVLRQWHTSWACEHSRWIGRTIHSHIMRTTCRLECIGYVTLAL